MSDGATAAHEEGGAPRIHSPLCAEDVMRTVPLLNAMVDVALVLGFDETCTKELRVPEEEREEEVREVEERGREMRREGRE